MVRAAAVEVWGLFVTDGLLAILAVVALITAGLFLSRTSGQRTNAGLLLVAGVVVALGISLWAAARRSVARNRAPEPAQEQQPARVE